MVTSETPTSMARRLDLSLPVLMKEMRSRMRGMRAPVLLFITTGLAILVGLLIVMPQWDSLSYSNNGNYYGSYSHTMADVGRTLFIGLVILESILCVLIAPALTAGSISIEREQQTLDLLLLTRLSNLNIVLGKLLSSLGFLFIILICAVPVAAISFLLGGVDPWQLGWSLLLILSTVALFGTIALYCSTRYTKTATSVAVSYCLCVVFMAVFPLFMLLFMMMYDNSSASHYLMDIPFVVFLSASSAVLGLIPAAILSIFLTLVIRRGLPRVANVALWAGSAVTILALLLLYGEPFHNLLNGSSIVYAFVGNPVAAMIAALIPNEYFSGSGSGSTFWLARAYVPITAGFLFICALLMLAQTVHEMRKLRRKLK